MTLTRRAPIFINFPRRVSMVNMCRFCRFYGAILLPSMLMVRACLHCVSRAQNSSEGKELQGLKWHEGIEMGFEKPYADRNSGTDICKLESQNHWPRSNRVKLLCFHAEKRFHGRCLHLTWRQKMNTDEVFYKFDQVHHSLASVSNCLRLPWQFCTWQVKLLVRGKAGRWQSSDYIV